MTAEETKELQEAYETNPNDHKQLEDEVGDILFVAANLARKVGVDPETALLTCNRKFERRFKFVESQTNERGLSLSDASLEEMEALWQKAKTSEVS